MQAELEAWLFFMENIHHMIWDTYLNAEILSFANCSQESPFLDHACPIDMLLNAESLLLI